MSVRAGSMYSGLFEFSHRTRCFMNSKHRFRGVSSIGLPFLVSRPELATAQHLTDEATEVFWAFRIVGIGNQRGKDRCPARCQRTASPPNVKGRDMPMSDRLLRADCSETSLRGRETS